MRLFVAIPLPPSVIELCKQLRAALEASGNGARPENRPAGSVRWVPPENYHITVRFLGQIQASNLTALCNALATLSASTAAFDLQFEQYMQAPTLKYARMYWARFAVPGGGEQFENLVREARRALAGFQDPAGIEEHEKAIAHVTLARFEPQNNVRQPLWRLPDIVSEERPVFRVARMELWESVQEPGKGSVYRSLATFPLNESEQNE